MSNSPKSWDIYQSLGINGPPGHSRSPLNGCCLGSQTSCHPAMASAETTAAQCLIQGFLDEAHNPMYLSARKYKKKKSGKKSKRNKNKWEQLREQLRTCLPSRSRSSSQLESAKGVISGMDPIHPTKGPRLLPQNPIESLKYKYWVKEYSEAKFRHSKLGMKDIERLKIYCTSTNKIGLGRGCKSAPPFQPQHHKVDCISTIKKVMFYGFYGVPYFNAVHRLCLRQKTHHPSTTLRTMTSH